MAYALGLTGVVRRSIQSLASSTPGFQSVLRSCGWRSCVIAVF